MNCKEIKDRLERYIDNELSVQEKAEVKKHLLKCSTCTKELEILKSINSFGKIATFPAPQPQYWTQLSQNILHKIAAPKEKISWVVHVLTGLKRIILPEKISYRLVGLAATAVIIFFLVQIFFFREGKFELPIEVGTEDAIKLTEQKASLSKPQPEVVSNKNVSTEKPAQQPSETPKLIEQQQVSQKSIAKVEPPLSGKALDQPAKKFDEVVIIDEDKADTPQDNVIPLSKAPVPPKKASKVMNKKMSDFSVQPAAVNLKAQQLERKGVKADYLPDKATIGFTQKLDSNYTKYNEVFLTAQKAHNFSKKIKTWEDYLNTQPDLEYVKKATYQQAVLYYKLAKQKNNKAVIQQAIKFYYQNKALLFSIEDADSVQMQIEELNDLMKKLEKK